jgi:hypothetical protein
MKSMMQARGVVSVNEQDQNPDHGGIECHKGIPGFEVEHAGECQREFSQQPDGHQAQGQRNQRRRENFEILPTTQESSQEPGQHGNDPERQNRLRETGHQLRGERGAGGIHDEQHEKGEQGEQAMRGRAEQACRDFRWVQARIAQRQPQRAKPVSAGGNDRTHHDP